MKLIADSSANLTMLEGVTYQSVPMTIRAGERDFVDDETLDTHELLDYLAAHNGKSGTACPSLDGWLKAFEGADEIFVITITSSLSGTCASAMAARDVYLQSHPEVKIHIFDTLSTGPEMQLLAEKLAELHAKGLPFDVICEKAQEYLATTHLQVIVFIDLDAPFIHRQVLQGQFDAFALLRNPHRTVVVARPLCVGIERIDHSREDVAVGYGAHRLDETLRFERFCSPFGQRHIAIILLQHCIIEHHAALYIRSVQITEALYVLFADV